MEMLSFEYAQISELSNRTKGETPHHSRERTDKETPDEEALLRKVWTRLNSAIRFISIEKHQSNSSGKPLPRIGHLQGGVSRMLKIPKIVQPAAGFRPHF